MVSFSFDIYYVDGTMKETKVEAATQHEAWLVMEKRFDDNIHIRIDIKR